jgi:DtxR family transcriptional regulator, Mn-dependent transcriptional regulator
MATSTVENYIKEIYLEHQRSGRELVSLGRLAAALSVVPGTVTTMVKALAEAKLVRYEPRHGVKLTSSGQKLALHVLRRHRLVELFLVRVLDVDWSEVHVEAEDLEHAISDKLLTRIDEFLGRPQFDPHGDPIPSATGKVSKRDLVPLSACESSRPMRIALLTDQDAQFLRYAQKHGLTPGATVRVETSDAVGDSITVVVDGRGALTLGSAAAQKIMLAPT